MVEGRKGQANGHGPEASVKLLYSLDRIVVACELSEACCEGV